jgi:hypothetical protein
MTETTTTEQAKDPRKIYLKNVKVVFANLVDEGFGRSITIDATAPEVATAIDEWVTANNIGKGDHAGKANFKTYEDTIQYALKINDSTKFVYANGLSESDLGFRAEISLAANAFDYDNKFGKGTSASLSAVVVHKGKATGADQDIEELMAGFDEELTEEEKLLKEQPF